jgi:DNA-binding LacI/PurR family transcriptional regulator
MQLAKDLGYSPNQTARVLRGKNTNVIGIVVENVSELLRRCTEEHAISASSVMEIAQPEISKLKRR